MLLFKLGVKRFETIVPHEQRNKMDTDLRYTFAVSGINTKSFLCALISTNLRYFWRFGDCCKSLISGPTLFYEKNCNKKV